MRPVADPSSRWPENAPGPWYVDEQCIDCEVCRDTAPTVFARRDPGGYSYVAAQPATARAVADARLALAECPVEAIGDDGRPPAAATVPGRPNH